MFGERIYIIGILLVTIFIVAAIILPKYSIRIVMKDGKVLRHEGVAKGRVVRVVEFLERDVQPIGNVTVLGGRDSRGILRIRFKGRLDDGTAQRIRNFLKMEL